MAAEPSADQMARMAAEIDDRTYLYVRRNRTGRWVRDAKFITDCTDLDVANALFAGHVEGAEVLLCGVLRGQVATVDDFEFADDPDVFAEPYETRLDLYAVEEYAVRRRFTVLGCWDTGDGFRRYSRQVDAIDALHAELQARSDKTAGTFLVAAVVEGWVPVEDRDVQWATVDGEPEPAEPEPKVWPWRTILLAVAILALAVVGLFAILI